MTLGNNLKLSLFCKGAAHMSGAVFCGFESNSGGSKGALIGYWIIGMYVLLTA